MTHTSGIRRPGRRPRRRAAAFALLLTASLAAAGCSSGADSSDSAAAGSDNKAAPSAAAPQDGQAGGAKDSPSGATGNESGTGGKPATGPTTPAPASYLVRTAELTVRTPRVARALETARGLAAAAGGYAGDEDTAVDSRGRAESSVQLRVPPAAYDRTLTDLAALGTLLERQVSVVDVTGEVVDVGSRIKSQQASVDRVRALMERADKLSDVVALEGELSTRQAALEALQAQRESLKSRTDLATITLRLTEPPVKAAAPKREKKDGFFTTIGDALGDGWHAFATTVRGILVVLSVTLPFLVAVLVIWFAARLVRRLRPPVVPAAPAPPVVPASLLTTDGPPRWTPAGTPTASTAPTAPAAPAGPGAEREPTDG